MPPSRSERLLTRLVAALAWFALALQFVLLLRATWNTKGPALATLQFFSYFTILSNLLVASVCTASLAHSRSTLRRFLTSASVRGAVALYIAVTGCIYLVILSSLWAPTGLQWIADTALHYAVPASYLMLWIFYAPRRTLAWSDALRWLAFPLAFLVWALVRGAWLHEYPYPFIDAGALGLARVLANAVGICLLFFVLGLVIVAFNRRFVHSR